MKPTQVAHTEVIHSGPRVAGEEAVPLREYVDVRLATRKEAVDQQFMGIEQQFEALEAQLIEAAKSIRDGLEKAERQLQVSLDKAQTELRLSLIDAEKRVNEKLDDRDKTAIKAQQVLDDRLGQMNLFRDQINSERLLYVTRDQLELNLKGLHDQMSIITKTLTMTSGKTEGVGTVGSIALNILVGIAALMSGISTFVVLTHIFK